MFIFIDLEISDLINCSPNLFTCRTPGQLLSLTSHLSFGSDKKNTCDIASSKFNKAMNNPSKFGNKLLYILKIT